MQQRAAQVDVVMPAHKQERDAAIHDDAGGGHPDHEPGMHIHRVQQAVEGLVPDIKRHQHQREAVYERCQHPGAVVAESLASVGTASCEVNGPPGEQQGKEVGKVVARLGKQRQAMGLDPRDYQQDDVRQRDQQRNAEHARGCGVARAGVDVHNPV